MSHDHASSTASPAAPQAAWLRWLGVRSAELTGGGCALVFTSQSGEGLALRAAAGFRSADEARLAAAELTPLLPAIDGPIATDAAGHPALPPLPAMGARGAAGTQLIALRFGSRNHGVLAVASPTPVDPRICQSLQQSAESVALHLDHAYLTGEIARLRAQRGPSRDAGPQIPEALAVPVPDPASDGDAGAADAEESGDELLKLSEALFAQDIELRRSREKLGKVEKLKNDFIEKMSRELRTPLNSIIESIIGVLAGENDRISDLAKTSLRTALDEGTAFQRTLQNILDLWRIKQRELPVEIQEVNFAEVVDETIFSVQDTLGDKPVRIEKRFDAALPKIRTDLGKLNQILFLLLDNAAKFTQEGGVEIGAQLRPGSLTCEIRDTGIGICPDDQACVFDEFFQVDELSSTRYRGAGLGLALVRDLLELLEGELSLESEAGRGTTVRFTIPVETH